MTQDNAQTALRAAGELAADVILTRRLVERHGLDETTAYRAVRQTRAREPNPHAELVRAEAAAVITEITDKIRPMVQVLRPVIVSISRSWQAAIEQIPAIAQIEITRRAERAQPAWQSPYGPRARTRTR